MNRAKEILDEDDWIEIERSSSSPSALPDVSVRLTAINHKGHGMLKARAFIVFRREAAKWIEASGPRFRVAIGGAKSNFLRIASDVHKGRFENSSFKGVQRLILGHVTAWPNEPRGATTAKWDLSRGWMTLELPEDFAIPVHKGAPPMPAPRTIVSIPGDPERGRSALDQRRGSA